MGKNFVMSKFKIVNLIDKFFVSAAIFLFIFAWINFYTRNLWLTFVLSLIFSASCVFILFYLLNKKQQKTFANKTQIENIEKCYLSFKLMPLKNQLNLLLCTINNPTAKIENNIIIFHDNNKKIGMVIATEYETITENIFLNLIANFRFSDLDELIIVCSSVMTFNVNIFSNKKFCFLTKEKLFENYFNASKIFPETDDFNSQKNKVEFIEILNKFFIPHKAKSYFVCGLILVFSSIILPYHFYYIIFGSTLLLFSIICKLKKIISH